MGTYNSENEKNYNYLIKIDESHQHNVISKKKILDDNIQYETFFKIKRQYF